MNSNQTVLFPDWIQKTDNICGNRPCEASQRDGEHDVTFQGGSIGTEMENVTENSGFESTDSEAISINAHLRGYDTDLNCYDDNDRTRAVRVQLEDLREKYTNNVSEMSVLKGELARAEDALRDQQVHVAGLESTVADVTADRDRQTRDLVRTLRRLVRDGASAAGKIAGLEEDKRAAERALNASTADLENVAAELARTRRRADEQERAAADYVVDGLRKLDALRRENDALRRGNDALRRDNDALRTHAASVMAIAGETEPRVDVGSQTFSTQRDLDGGTTSRDHSEFLHRSEGVQIRRLHGQQSDGDETKTVHGNEECCSCRRTLAALRKKVAKYKSCDANKWNEYKSNVRIKDRQFADMSNEFKNIIDYKNEMINFERNHCTKIKKQLDDKNVLLLELETQNAHDGHIKYDDQMKALAQEIANQKEKVVELSSCIQGLRVQLQMTADKSQKFTKTSKSVRFKSNSCRLKNRNATTTQAAVHLMCTDKSFDDGRTEKREANESHKSDMLRVLNKCMQQNRHKIIDANFNRLK